jgi:hypothetical protein
MSSPVFSSARLGGVVGVALLFGGAFYAGRVLDAASGRHVTEEAERAARAAAESARVALMSEGHAVSKLAGDAVGIPPLAAAVSASRARCAPLCGSSLATA